MEVEPIRGRSYGQDWGKVHAGVVEASGRDALLFSLCSVVENRRPVYGYRIHRRFDIECQFCRRLLERGVAGLKVS